MKRSGSSKAAPTSSVSHERKPGGVLHPVVVVIERLACVEGRVDVDELDFAPVLTSIFGRFSEDPEHVETVTREEPTVGVRVVVVDLTERVRELGQAYL